MARDTGSLMPPMHILNAPTGLMKNLGYGSGYVYDHATEEGFSGQNYFPDGVAAPRILPPDRARLRARDQEAARLLGQAAPAGCGRRRMSGVTTVTVRPEDGSGRLDRWFKRHYPGLGHGRLEKLLRTGQIRVDGKRARAGDPVAPGQSIRVPPLPEAPAAAAEPAKPPRARPQDVALLRDAVLYRDDWALIVLNKPAGLAVQGGTNTERHVDALLDGLRFESATNGRASCTGSTRTPRACC